MANGNGTQTATSAPQPPPVPDHLPDLRIQPLDTDELQQRTVRQARAALPQVQSPEDRAASFADWEKQQQEQWAKDHPILPPNSRLGQAYDHLKSIVSEHEGQISEKYLAPIREHLDRMGNDLVQAGETGHTRTGGQLNPVTRLLTLGTGELLKQVPIGANVKETLAANIVPPEFGPEGKALSKELKATKAVDLSGLRVARAEHQFNEFRVSTRVPEGRDAIEHPLKGEPLTVGLATVKQAPEKLQDRFVDSVSGIAGFKVPKNTDRDKVFQQFVRHAADNLKWLHDQVPEKERIANAKWYESANKVANDLATKHELTPQQTAGVIASLSPQMDWDMNVSLAKRLVDVYKNHANDVVTPEMITKGREIIKASRKTPATKDANRILEEILGTIRGRKIGELTGQARAAAIRLYDEVHNTRSFPKIDPATGNELELRTNADGSPSALAWGNLTNAEKALAILDDGSRANISDKVGDSHKVRSFYNNILDPSHPKDVTVDTHAVAAALLHPLSGSAKEVLDNFGNAGKNKGTGIVGNYPLYAEAYRLAARERGLLPREMQSITWEQVRKMFPSEWKTKENLARVKSEWRKYEAGKQSAAQTRQKIADLAKQK